MTISDAELTRQDEDMSAKEFAVEEVGDGHDFGNWPEMAGLLFTLFVSWLIFALTG